MRKYICVLAILLAALLSLTLIACAPTPQATDPASVTKALFNAINQGKAEAAANCFADDGQLIWAFGQPKGTKKLHDYIQNTLIPMKTKLTIITLTADGENATGVFSIANRDTQSQFPNGAPPLKLDAVVQSGKIKTMTWSTNK
jgi:hypothetical protein